MSTKGYNGRQFKVLKDDVAIAAVQSKTAAHNRSPVETTNDDSNGDRQLLGDPALRSIDISISGVVTIDNGAQFLEEWNGTVMADIVLQHPDGTLEECDDGFFLGNLELGGEHDGYMTFTAQLMSSGSVTITPASS